MYALGAALNALYKRKTGAAADFYDDVLVAQIWRKLKLSPPAGVTRRTYDAIAQPFTGWGLTFHRDDLAKLATFVNVDHGMSAGVPLVDTHMLMAALQRDPTETGLRASTEDFRYHNGFWAWNAQSALGCRAPAWISLMSGFGGIVVSLMPNGVTYYYVSDSGVYAWARAAAEADKIKPFCEK